MSKELTLSTLFDGFREKETIFAVAKKISKLAEKLPEKMYIMEVCGGHTHTINIVTGKQIGRAHV